MRPGTLDVVTTEMRKVPIGPLWTPSETSVAILALRRNFLHCWEEMTSFYGVYCRTQGFVGWVRWI